jgi:surfactin family lipopeptide synthetase A
MPPIDQNLYSQSNIQLDKQLDYWKRQLINASLVLELPTDKPRPLAQTYKVEKQSFILPSSLLQALYALSQQEGVTIFSTLLAAFQTLLYRYSRQEDILVGCPATGEKANTLVLRTNMSGNPTFRDLLQKVHSVVLEAKANQDVPFEKLVEELQIERSHGSAASPGLSLSYHPLFQVMFAYQTASQETLQSVTCKNLDKVISNLDLTLLIEETEEGIQGTWQYNVDLFNAATITRISGHFQSSLEQIVADPIQQIHKLPLLSETERQQLLLEWNNTYRDYPQRCIHELFEEQVKRTPDAVAIVFEDKQLTYQQLNNRANQLAHHLRSLGVEPEVLVGLFVERSIEMIVGLLAILKAGGAYVPLDPSYPTQRLAYQSEDSGIKVLLTQQKLLTKLPDHSVATICLDTDRDKFSQASTNNPVTLVKPENLAYVIYTSGSTGQPKGVMVPHSCVVNFTQTSVDIYGINQSDRVLQFSSFGFDIAVEEIYPCLTVGGTLVLRTDEMLGSVQTFVQKCQEWEITVLDLPTAYWHQLTTSLATTNEVFPPSLRLVIIGGEKVLPEYVRIWQNLVGERPALINSYGPTETTVVATIYQISAKTSLVDGQQIPIGRPIGNVQVFVLDANEQPVPIGVPGELYIGGAGVARGYLNRPELTREKFIPNPWTEDETSRLYKTGDLVRYLPNGELEYIGRIDNQVKVRGFRIELGEIETVVSQHPSVLQTVVLAREDEPGNKRLVAYVVVKPKHPLTSNELRGFAKEQLPDYMLPSTFVFLEALPLTPNGKVDRRALPAPSTSDLIDVSTFIAPRTELEETLATIWSQVLGLEQVGIDNNFFELGGHSLLATQVISRLRQAFGVELSLQQLFERPTVADLANAIATLQNQGTNENLIIPRRANRNSAPLSYVQQQLWFLAQLQPDSAAYNIAEAMQLQGNLKVDVLQKSLDAIVIHHEALRTTFVAEDGNPVQVIGEPRSVELKIIDLKNCPSSKRPNVVQQWLQNEAQRPFNLESDLMLRACLLELSPQEHILMLVMHHIATDGWSMSILFEQLKSLYKAFANNLPNPLPELSIQFADYVVWQRQWLQGEVLEKQLSYWKQKLANAPTVLELPTDRQRPPIQSFRGATQYFEIPQSLLQALNALSRKEGVTLFMTLLGAFQTLLYRYTGQQDILIGSPIAGRNRTEVENLIGFFVNTLVLRTDLSGNPSFKELLQRVRDMAVSAYANQDVPFEKLVQELQPERSLSYHPLFQVMFVLQNTPGQTLELPGLTVTPVEVDKLASQFDLTLSMEATEQGLQGVWEYSTDLFDTATITRMTGHFQTLLEQIVANPIQQIDTLPLLSATERQQLLVEWNNTYKDYPQHCVHQFFEQQVTKTPDAVAVVFEDEQLTYQQLDRRANQLAHYLRTLGVRPDVLVGICVERSLEMVIGLLGILKAGGAYVPLDPEYPKERLAFIVSDTNTPVMLTQEKLVKNLPELAAQIVCLDSHWDSIAQHSTEQPVSGVTVENLMYIIYTSGSTGTPKGVMISHQGICNALYWRQETFQLTPQDKILQTISLSFDPSVWQVFWPLSFGGQLIVARPGGHRDAAYFVKETIERQITVLGLVPSIIQALLEEKGFENCQTLRHVTTGGEALSIELLERFFACLNLDNVLVNCYGPTEASIDVTTWVCQRGTHATTAPIGRPIANVQVYVLDRNLQPVPLGHSGELYVGGIGVARGYLNRPELTQEKFIPNPFSDKPDARLYKTGDLVRYLPDGNIEFLGRIDDQVKVRGFRIELGEIEATLNTYPGLQQSLVMVREDIPGKKGLVAYFVAQPEQVVPNPSELRSFLQERLPDYMIPAAFVKLDAMPLNPNGKVDRRALPAPDTSDFSDRTNFVAPRTPTEETLATIWMQVLGLEQVGIHDNFFELGGHSLLATQVISRLREVLGVDIQLQLLFQIPTIADLAEAILQIQAENTDDDEMSRLLAELENLSDEEAQNLLAKIM